MIRARRPRDRIARHGGPARFGPFIGADPARRLPRAHPSRPPCPRSGRPRSQETPMYDFYPEWGPARHRDENEQTPTRRPRYWREPALAGAGAPTAGTAVSVGAEARDADRDRPTTTRLPPHDPHARPSAPALQDPRSTASPSSPVTASGGGHRRGPQGPRRGDPGRREVRDQPLRPRRRALPRHRRGAARTRCSRRSAGTTRSCSARWAASPATRTCRPASSSAGCCCGCASSSTTT